MTGTLQTFALIFTMAFVTALIRFLPFLMFEKRAPKIILYLGDVLPCAVIAMLVIYCLKDMRFDEPASWAPTVISCAVVAAVHKWKHNVLLSILAGTILYMVLIQTVWG